MNKREEEFIKAWQDYAPEDSDDLIVGNDKLMDYLENGGYFTAPASTKYHGAYEGGLYDHSKQVFLRLKRLTEDNSLEWERPESPFIIGMFHDLCKCDQYNKVDKENRYEHNTNTLLKGHGSKSVMLLSRFLVLTDEEMVCIRYHMGAYEKEEWQEFDMAIKMFPNVLWTHTADMLASKVDGI